jgi:hypothetical protein
MYGHSPLSTREQMRRLTTLCGTDRHPLIEHGIVRPSQHTIVNRVRSLSRIHAEASQQPIVFPLPYRGRHGSSLRRHRTSPLYALRECFHESHGLPVTADNVLGILSMIVWSLVLVVTVKYLLFVMKADNEGEGGMLALMALSQQSRPVDLRKGLNVVVTLGLIGVAFLYSDGIITPAISVLSAVEGLTLTTDVFTPLHSASDRHTGRLVVHDPTPWLRNDREYLRSHHAALVRDDGPARAPQFDPNP